MVHARLNASEGDSDLYSFSIICKHVMRGRVVTNYIRKRLSIQNEKNWSLDRALGNSTSQKRRRFYFIYSYYLCPALHVKIEERQSKITNTKSVFEASQKDAMIDIVSKAALRSRRVRMEIEPESEAGRRSLKTRRRAVSVLCFGR